MTPDQIEEVIERTASETARRVDEKMRTILSGLGFNMDPDKMHEEQQMVAFLRTMHQGTRRGVLALFTGIITALATVIVGGMVYLFRPHQ